MMLEHQKTAACVLSLCLTFGAAPPAFAQADRPAAQKFDEFGDIPLSEIAMRLDNFANELQSQPQAKGFVIAYRSRRDLPGLSGRLMVWMRDHLTNSRGLPAERVVGVDGGVAGCVAHELWIVPLGAAPKPRGDAYQTRLEDVDSARKFDEAAFFNAPRIPESYYQTIYLSLEGFADALRKNPRANGYLIAYGGQWTHGWFEGKDGRGRWRQRVNSDPPGTAKREMASVKASLIKNHGIRASRIRTMDGGYRSVSSMELWIVPRGEHPPIPTPNVFPRGRR